MAVDSFIYFANIRPDYMWCYFGKTVAFVNGNAGLDTSSVTFWDTVSNQVRRKLKIPIGNNITFSYKLQCYLKQIDTPLGIASSQDHCVIAVEYLNVASKDPNMTVETNFKDRKYQLLVCNSISTTVDCKNDYKLSQVKYSYTYCCFS